MTHPTSDHEEVLAAARRMHARTRLMFAAAAALAPERRTAFVNDACEGDAQLAATVLELLAHAEASAEPDSRALRPEAAHRLGPGARIGPYRLEASLGQGGMGSVFQARQEHPVARTVALKLLDASPGTLRGAGSGELESRIRFESESQALATLDHPGICRYFDSGATESGVAYLAMELIEGARLDAHVREARPAPSECARIALAIADALAHAHQRGIVHRDLKPGNVLMRRDERGVHPVVIDFGIAAAIEGSDLAAMLPTLRLSPLGTPAYMAPEQTRLGRTTDVRTDVFALGALLFLLLSGRDPLDLHRGGAGEQPDLVATFLRIRNEPAPRPSERIDAGVFGSSSRRRCAQVRGDLDAIVGKALEKEADRRYGSMVEFAADLRRFLAGEAIAARPIGPLARLGRLVRRRPLEATAGAVAAAGLVAGLGFAIAGRAQAVAAEREARAQAEIAGAVTAFLSDELLARAAPELDGPRTPVIDIVRAAIAQRAQAIDAMPEVGAGVHLALARVLAGLDELDAAQAELRRAEAALAEAGGGGDRLRALQVEEAAIHLKGERYAEAETLLRRALEGAPPEWQVSSAGLRARTLLGTALVSAARPREAIEVLEPLEAFARRRPVPERIAAASAIAWARFEVDRGNAAVDGLRALLSDVREARGADHLNAMSVETDLAVMLLMLYRPEEALPHAERALAIALANFPDTHPTALTARNNLASCYGHLRLFDESLAERRRILEAHRALGTPDGPTLATTFNNLATALIRAERAEEAIAPAREGATMAERFLGPRHATAAWAWATCGSALARTGRREDALEAYERAFAIFAAAEGDHSADVARVKAEQDRLLGSGMEPFPTR